MGIRHPCNSWTFLCRKCTRQAYLRLWWISVASHRHPCPFTNILIHRILQILSTFGIQQMLVHCTAGTKAWVNKSSPKKKMCFCIVMFISVPGSGMIESQMQDTFFWDGWFTVEKTPAWKRCRQQHNALLYCPRSFCITFKKKFKCGALRTLHFFLTSVQVVVLCLGVTVLKIELLSPFYSDLNLCWY